MLLSVLWQKRLVLAAVLFASILLFGVAVLPAQAAALAPDQRYENTNANITYGAGWSVYSTTGPSGGSYHYTNTTQGEASFTVDNGQNIIAILIGLVVCNICGETEVLVDGETTPRYTINAYAPNTHLQYPAQYWSASQLVPLVLSSGTHTIRLRHKAGQNPALFTTLDTVTIISAKNQLTTGPTYQGTATSTNTTTVVGQWWQYNDGGASGGSIHWTNDSSAMQVFRFTGDGIQINRTMYLGGYGPLEICLYSEQARYQCRIAEGYTNGILWGQPFAIRVPNNTYTVTLRPLNYAYVGIDSIQVLGAASTLGLGSYAETNPNITFTGNWASYNWYVGAQLGSLHYTNDPNGKLTFLVDGSTVRYLRVYRTIFPAVYGSLQVYINGSPVGNPISGQDGNLIESGRASEAIEVPTGGPHTVEIRNTSSMYIGIDRIELRETPTQTPQEEILLLVNQARCTNGLVPLALNNSLVAAAQNHAVDMGTAPYYFSHTGRNGSTPAQRAQGQGYPGSYVGENIAVGYSTVQEAFQGWMNSSGHRANILRPEYREIGIGYYSNGTWEGDSWNFYWVQVFGNRSGATGGTCPGADADMMAADTATTTVGLIDQPSFPVDERLTMPVQPALTSPQITAPVEPTPEATPFIPSPEPLPVTPESTPGF
ncbi:MAG: CAP domain-containing protein [bacterium]|nr:CAP domain-containing protein [bacterium]